ncbi:MAG TPA: hypothetical protein VHF22_06540, partial [Planctomycetota bacterium]|nr:hypothetical protein [Planctomycetota bacterium]
MPAPADVIARLFRGVRPSPGAAGAPAPAPIGEDEVRGLIREMAAAPPKELVAALARLEGETIEKVTEFNQLEVLAHLVANHGGRQERLLFAKCAALNGAMKPAGADQPGAGAAAATALAADPELLDELRIEKGEFPPILVDGIYWNCVWTRRGKYVEPPPIHDYAPLATWSDAVARSGNARLKAQCLRSAVAALGRHDPRAHKIEAKPTPEDPFGMKAVQAEQERIRTAKRVPVEGFLAILQSDLAGPVDELRAGGKGELARLLRAALDLDDPLALEAIGVVYGWGVPTVPEGSSAEGRAAFLRERCDLACAERLGFLAASLDRALHDLKVDVRRKAGIYAKIALASLGRRIVEQEVALGMQKKGEVDPVFAALEKRYLDKAAADPTQKKILPPTVDPMKFAKQAEKSVRLAAPPMPFDRVAASPCADLLRPRELRPEGMI